MTDLFFYGTLRHAPLLACVLGRDADDIDMRAAELPDHSIFGVSDQLFPMIAPDAGSRAKGLLVRGLTDEDIARLNFYEGGFDYDLRRMIVWTEEGGEASADVYFPRDGAWEPGAPWSLSRWVERWGALSVRAATEVMSYYGRLTPEQVAHRFPSIRIRASAWLSAQNRPADTQRKMDQDVEILRHDFAFLNFFSHEEVDLRFRRYDGSMSDPVNRSAHMVGEAVVVLPYDPVRDVVLLVEQFRAPVFLSGDRSPWVWEPVAGLVDPGETPEQAARREAQEEAGLTLHRLEPAGEAYSSTGSSGEYLYLFIAIADLTETVTGAGVPEEGEDIRSAIFSFEELDRGLETNRWRDMPLVTTAHWLARHRDRLREGN